MALADNAPVACVPLAASAPLQLPEAAHEVALVDVQVRVELDELATAIGDALRVTVGAGTGAGLSAPPQDASSSTLTASHRE